MANKSNKEKQKSALKSTLEQPAARVYAVKEGLPVSMVHEMMAEYGINKSEMARLVQTSVKTLNRFITEDKPLSVSYSDRVLELAELYQKGEEVFGSKEKFLRWLETSLPAFDKARPIDWIDTQQGIDAVMDELGRIEHGIFS